MKLEIQPWLMPRVLVGLLGFLLALPSATAWADVYSNSINGAACAGANLGQSLNLGTQWTQRGVFNTQPEGGQDLYVVCPVMFTPDYNTDPYYNQFSTIYVSYFYGTLTKPVQISCTSHQVSSESQGTAKLVTAVADISCSTSGCGTAAKGGYIYMYPIAEKYANAYYNSFAVICALPPQTGIKGLSFYN